MPDAAEQRILDDKILAPFLREGRFIALPVRQGKRLSALRWFARRFEPGCVYPEKEVNAIIQGFYPDYCTVRRELVDFGFMSRERGEYRLLENDKEIEKGTGN